MQSAEMSKRDGCQYSHTIGIYAMGGRGFLNPVDVAPARDGVLYVLNRSDEETADRMTYKRVTVCTVDEEYIGEFSTGGTENGQLMWPVSIALDRDENIYISDEALHRVSIFNKQGQFLDKWGVKGRGDGEFDRPAGLAFDENDNLLVVDSLNHRVQRYTKDGRLLGAGAGGVNVMASSTCPGASALTEPGTCTWQIGAMIEFRSSIATETIWLAGERQARATASSTGHRRWPLTRRATHTSPIGERTGPGAWSRWQFPGEVSR